MLLSLEAVMSRCDARIFGNHLWTMKRPSEHAKDDQGEPESLTRILSSSTHEPGNHLVFIPKTTCLSCFDLKVLPPIAEDTSSNRVGPVEKYKRKIYLFIRHVLQQSFRTGLSCLTQMVRCKKNKF